eukprot:jgi/Mesvir1/617/Mv02048-RA.1
MLHSKRKTRQVVRKNVVEISPNQATIIVPTVDPEDDFEESLRTWLRNDPAEIIIVTDTKAYNSIRWRVAKLQDSRILVIPSLIANKRRQMMLGVKAAKTPYIVFVDDDVIFPERAMAWILAPFADPAVGAVGTSQIARPSAETVRLRKGKMTVWEIMADIRLQLRFVENASTQVLDSGISCLSGRTAAYRRCIFTPQFEHEFTNEFWMGRKLHSGDDKFLTRWVVKNRWKTALQIHEDCLIQTTFRADSRFLKQVLRWSRNTWRSDFKSLFMDRIIWRAHPFVTLLMLDKFINPFTILYGPAAVIFICANKIFPPYEAICIWVGWLLISRSIKCFKYLKNHPTHIIHIPFFILFTYMAAFIKIYALLTLHITDWGTRASSNEVKDAKNPEFLEQRDLQGWRFQPEGDALASPSNATVDRSRAGSGSSAIDSHPVDIPPYDPDHRSSKYIEDDRPGSRGLVPARPHPVTSSKASLPRDPTKEGPVVYEEYTESLMALKSNKQPVSAPSHASVVAPSTNSASPAASSQDTFHRASPAGSDTVPHSHQGPSHRGARTGGSDTRPDTSMRPRTTTPGHRGGSSRTRLAPPGSEIGPDDMAPSSDPTRASSSRGIHVAGNVSAAGAQAGLPGSNHHRRHESMGPRAFQGLTGSRNRHLDSPQSDDQESQVVVEMGEITPPLGPTRHQGSARHGAQHQGAPGVPSWATEIQPVSRTILKSGTPAGSWAPPGPLMLPPSSLLLGPAPGSYASGLSVSSSRPHSRTILKIGQPTGCTPAMGPPEFGPAGPSRAVLKGGIGGSVWPVAGPRYSAGGPYY